PLADGDKVKIGALEGRVLGIPAHTNGHVAYYFPTLEAVFTGDTMFVGGCGRVFEGKAATMVASLKKLASLPDSTQVYCGHESTEKTRVERQDSRGAQVHRAVHYRRREKDQSISAD